VSDQTVGNILKRHGIPPVPERKKTTTWTEFIRSHMDVLAATDFFTAEVWTQGRLVTYYVLFFMHLATRRVHIAGITPHPNEPWMIQVARNVTMADVGFLSSSRYLIHDRDSKFCESFRDTIEGVSVTPIRLPARSPDLNTFAAALGELGQRGMSLEAHLVRGELAASRAEGVRRPSSSREESSRQGQSLIVPRARDRSD
jgi:putative transposase